MAGVVVAIDAGTTGVRALAVDARARVADVAYRELTQHFPRPGWVEHDPDEIWDSVRATLAELGARLAERGDTVAAIGITNQRETLVAFDRSTGRPLHRAIVWQDRRTAALCAELTEAGHLPLGAGHHGPRARSVLQRHEGGLAPPPRRPRPGGRRPRPLLLHGGQLGAVEPHRRHPRRRLRHRPLQRQPHAPAGHGHPRLVPRALRPLRRARRRRCPRCGPSAGRFGTAALGDLGPAAAVLDGVPVAGVLGDQQAALFGQACFDPGMVKVTYGTGSFALANAGPERPAAPDGLTVSCAWDLGRPRRRRRGRVAYALEGSTFVSGAAIQWLRDGLGIISSAAEIGPLAASVPDSGGVTFVPALTGLGSPWWDPAARGIVTGLTRGVGRAHLARACVEAMAFQVRDMTDAMAAASASPLSALRADGGAAAMDLLLALQAEQSRMPVARPASLESTALGAATVAGLAEGMWSSLDELAGLWRAETVFEPELPVELTDALHAVWRRAVEKSMGWADIHAG